jgi:hypothetical protein
MDSTNSPTTQPLFRGTQIVWYAAGLIEVLLAFRLALKMLEANPASRLLFVHIWGHVYIHGTVSQCLPRHEYLRKHFRMADASRDARLFGVIAYGMVKLFSSAKPSRLPRRQQN